MNNAASATPTVTYWPPSPITGLFSDIDEDHLTGQAKQLCKAASEGKDLYQHLARDAQAGSLRISDPSYPYGILLAEAARLMREFQYTCDILQHGVDHPAQQESPH